MATILEKTFLNLAFYTFALFNFCLYLGLSIRSGSFFRKNTEQDKLQLAIARDQFWNLSKTIAGLSHRFFTLRDGRQLHYLTNNLLDPESSSSSKPLVVLLHGFPDSSLMWRHFVESSSSLREKATLVAVDLPGYGGSDGFKQCSTDEVLEALADFIIGMRELYLESQYVNGDSDLADQQRHSSSNVYVVGHDWGCALTYRLAAEAPGLADRFIVTNGPLVHLALSNKDGILDSSRKIFHTFLHAPIARRSCLGKAYRTIKPLLIQLLMFGYIAAFHLPSTMVKYLGTGGNSAFLRGALRSAHGKDKSEWNLAEAMACSLGPSENECHAPTSDKDDSKQYSAEVRRRGQSAAESFYVKTAYYRDGVATQRWDKTLETIAALHNIEVENSASTELGRRRTSSTSAGLFESPYVGSLRAPVTVIWGQKDLACTQRICLDGIADYLAKDSQVVLLPRTGHWTAVEKESRLALARVVEWYVDGANADGKGDVGDVVKAVYPDATVMVRR